MDGTLTRLLENPVIRVLAIIMAVCLILVIFVVLCWIYFKIWAIPRHYHSISTIEDAEIPESIMTRAIRYGEAMVFNPESDSNEPHSIGIGHPVDAPFVRLYVRIKRRDFVVTDDCVMVNRPGTTPLVFTNARDYGPAQ